MCGAPRALGESIVFCWGDALGLAYVEVVYPDSSIRGPGHHADLFARPRPTREGQPLWPQPSFGALHLCVPATAPDR